MDVEESGVLDCFVEAGAELQRTQVAPEGDAYTFSQIAGTTGVTMKGEDLSEASAVDVLAALRAVTNDMDEKQVSTGSRYLFITPTLRGVMDDFSLANPTRSNRVLERFSCIVEVPQVRFYTAIDLLSGDDDQFGYQKAAGTYEKTADTEVDSSKTYYTESGGVYTAVASPTKSGLANYYELVGRRSRHQLHGGGEVSRDQVRQARGVARVQPRRAGGARLLHAEVPQYGMVDVLENKLDGVYVGANTE